MQNVRDIVHKTNRFNRKKLLVPPRTFGIPADYAQYIIHTGLCTVCCLCSLSGLSERVSYSDYATGCKIQDLDPSRDVILLFTVMSRQAVLKTLN